jgi:hypothetical protein
MNCGVKRVLGIPSGPAPPTGTPILPVTSACRSSSRVPVQPAAVELLAALSSVLAR